MSPVYLYRLFDADGELLYIGCSNDVTRRVEQHMRKGTGGGEEIASYTTEEYPTRSAGLSAEARAIRDEQPRVNILHKLSRGVDLRKVGSIDGDLTEIVAWRVAQRMLVQKVGVIKLSRECNIPPTRLARSLVKCNFRVDDLYAIATHLGTTVPALFAPVEVTA